MLNTISVALGANASIILFLLAFFCAAGLFYVAVQTAWSVLTNRRRVREQLAERGIRSGRALLATEERTKITADLPVKRFFESSQNSGNVNSVEARLHRAGFYGKSALSMFYVVRTGLCFIAFLTAFVAGRAFLPSTPLISLFIMSLAVAAFILVGAGMVLDRKAGRRAVAYRRGFPDFMDTMIICADAGMSLEAAMEKVAAELSYTHKELGIHLRVMTLEIRAGRRLREALHNMADRIGIEEAKTLAVLFAQSEELGTGLTQALRVYSTEMREKRMVRAEEKAAALPVKMVLPLGLFIFPVVLVIIMAPVVVSVLEKVGGSGLLN